MSRCLDRIHDYPFVLVVVVVVLLRDSEFRVEYVFNPIPNRQEGSRQELD